MRRAVVLGTIVLTIASLGARADTTDELIETVGIGAKVTRAIGPLFPHQEEMFAAMKNLNQMAGHSPLGSEVFAVREVEIAETETAVAVNGVTTLATVLPNMSCVHDSRALRKALAEFARSSVEMADIDIARINEFATAFRSPAAAAEAAKVRDHIAAIRDVFKTLAGTGTP